MSEEEKKVIEILKNQIEQVKLIAHYGEGYTYIIVRHIEILLNLIDKLQKENETLKEENFDQVYMKAIADYKEKIRNKIKDLDLIDEYYGPNGWESEREYAKDILKELLKEE